MNTEQKLILRENRWHISQLIQVSRLNGGREGDRELVSRLASKWELPQNEVDKLWNRKNPPREAVPKKWEKRQIQIYDFIQIVAEIGTSQPGMDFLHIHTRLLKLSEDDVDFLVGEMRQIIQKANETIQSH